MTCFECSSGDNIRLRLIGGEREWLYMPQLEAKCKVGEKEWGVNGAYTQVIRRISVKPLGGGKDALAVA